MPLAILIIVGLALLAIAISRINAQSGGSSIREAVAVQAFYAADSGAQYAMNYLFFPTAERSTADTNCDSLSGEPNLSFAVPGLQNCEADLSCSRTADDADTTSYYLIQSVAVCGAGEFITERSIKLSAFIQ